MNRLLLPLLSLSLLSCDDQAASAPIDYPPGSGALQIELTSTDPISADWVAQLVATQEDCGAACADPVRADLAFRADVAQALVFVPPGTWGLTLEVRDVRGTLLYVGSASGVVVQASFVTSVRIALTPAAGGLQISGEIDLGAERFLCGEYRAWAQEGLRGLHGAQRVGGDGALSFHLFADRDDGVRTAASGRAAGPWDRWQATDLDCGGGRLEDVTVGLGGFVAVCHDRSEHVIRIQRSADGLAWTPFGFLDYEVKPGDSVRACALVVDDQLNLFCAAEDQDGAGRARAGLLHAASPDGGAWTPLPDYDPETSAMRFIGLAADVATPSRGLLDVRVTYHAGVYLLWGTWWRDDGDRVAVHARSLDRTSWRFAGPESVTDLKTPRADDERHSLQPGCWITARGRLWCNRDTPELDLPARWRSATLKESDGGHAACGLDDRGGLWCWGDNGHGQLGLGDNVDRELPERVEHPEGGAWAAVEAGSRHTCALDARGGLWCWGANDSYQLAVGSGGANRPRRVGEGSAWTALSVADLHGCAIDRSKGLHCWGTGLSGNLGNGSSTAPRPGLLRVGGASEWVDVRSGYASCALRRTGALWCWGSGSWHTLGIEGAATPSPPRQLGGRWAQADSSVSPACALDLERRLWCWGDNHDGEVGDGSRETRLTPVRVAGPDEPWASVHVGHRHATAFRPDGAMWQFGYDPPRRILRPELGPTGPEYAPAPVHHPVVFRDLDGHWTMLAGANAHALTLCAGLPLVDDARLARPGLFAHEVDALPWRLTRGASVTIAVDDGAGSCAGVGDPRLRVYRDGIQVLFNDDGGPAFCPLVEAELDAGDYEIRVDGFAGRYLPPFTLAIQLAPEGAQP